MTEKYLRTISTISDRLSALHGHIYFRPEEGALMETLKEAVLDAVDGEIAEELAEVEFDIEVSVGCQEGDKEPMVGFRVDRPGFAHTAQLALGQLSREALEELDGYLARHSEAALSAETEPGGKNIVRKQPGPDFHEKGAASARLKVSPEWLKSVVPCTDYSYEEIEGKKYIREYYWSKELIERLFKIKSSKTTPEDLQFVATECCDGDQEWARDLIARLKSPNRPEPAPRGEQQKGQGKQGQQGQRPGQQLANRPAPAKGGQGERLRPRSRHKKPSRDQRKEGARRPEQAAEPKQPQG